MSSAFGMSAAPQLIEPGDVKVAVTEWEGEARGAGVPDGARATRWCLVPPR